MHNMHIVMYRAAIAAKKLNGLYALEQFNTVKNKVGIQKIVNTFDKHFVTHKNNRVAEELASLDILNKINKQINKETSDEDIQKDYSAEEVEPCPK